MKSWNAQKTTLAERLADGRRYASGKTIEVAHLPNFLEAVIRPPKDQHHLSWMLMLNGYSAVQFFPESIALVLVTFAHFLVSRRPVSPLSHVARSKHTPGQRAGEADRCTGVASERCAGTVNPRTHRTLNYAHIQVRA